MKKNEKFKKSISIKPRSIKETCIELNEEGKGLVKYNGNSVPVPYLLKDEKALIEISRKGKFYNTKVLSIISSSKNRVKPKCPYFYKCGGCQLQHMSYESQLHYKENKVKELMKSYGSIEKIISMENPYEYRNKIHSTFASYKRGEIISGMYEEHSHKVIPMDKCIIQDSKADPILKTIRELVKSFKISTYNENRRQGFLRHVLIKTGFKSGQIMVVFVVNNKIFPSKNNFVKSLLQKHPEITTISMNVNDRDTTMVLGDRDIVLYGKGYIQDELCGLNFRISPKSFYQINPIQTEKLYNKAIEMADLKGDEIILDAYSGIGTISLIASKKAKEVIGVELNKDAVQNSIKNSKVNKIKNTKFYQGDAGEFMVKMANKNSSIDLVFMDPPRSGSDEKFLSSIVKLSPLKIVYISCNPITQARDLKYLTSKGYKIEKIQPVDMFPHTYHVETIVRLTKKILILQIF